MGAFLLNGQNMFLILTYLCGINLVTFLVFAWDKRSARLGNWRVPERRLLQLACVGGSIGAKTAQQKLRHKTTKQPFANRLRLILCVQIVCAIVLIGFWFMA